MRQPTLHRNPYIAFLSAIALSTLPGVADAKCAVAETDPGASPEQVIGAFPTGVRPDRFWINGETGEYWAIAERDGRIVIIHDGVAAAQSFEKLARATAISFDNNGKPYFFATDGDKDFEVRGERAKLLAERIDAALSVRPLHVGAAMTPVFAAGRDGGQVLFIGDVVTPLSEKPVRYSANAAGDRFAYVISKNGKEYLFVNGTGRDGPLEEIRQFRLSDAGDRLAYFAKDAGAWTFRSGDFTSPTFDNLLASEISADARRFIAAVERSGVLAVETDSGLLEVLTTVSNVMVINKDGSRTAHLRPGDTDGIDTIVVDRAPGPALRSVNNIEFSASGAKVAYWGLSEARRGLIWIDGATITLDRKSRSIENAGFVGETFFWIARSGSRTLLGRDNAIIARHKGEFRFEAASERHGVVASRQRSNAAPRMVLNDASLAVPRSCRSILRRSVMFGDAAVSAACLTSAKEILTFKSEIPAD